MHLSNLKSALYFFAYFELTMAALLNRKSQGTSFGSTLSKWALLSCILSNASAQEIITKGINGSGHS